MVALLISFSALLCFVYGQAGWDCNAVQVSWIQYQALDICLGQQLTTDGKVETSSSQYSCNDEHSRVNLLTYDNADCQGEPTNTQSVQTDTEYFECKASSLCTCIILYCLYPCEYLLRVSNI